MLVGDHWSKGPNWSASAGFMLSGRQRCRVGWQTYTTTAYGSTYKPRRQKTRTAAFKHGKHESSLFVRARTSILISQLSFKTILFLQNTHRRQRDLGEH